MVKIKKNEEIKLKIEHINSEDFKGFTSRARGSMAEIKPISDSIIVEKPNVAWEDVAVLEAAKEALKEAVILLVFLCKIRKISTS